MRARLAGRAPVRACDVVSVPVANETVMDAITTVTFEDAGGKTKLTIRMRFESRDVLGRYLNLGMSDGWAESLVKLGIKLTGQV